MKLNPFSKNEETEEKVKSNHKSVLVEQSPYYVSPSFFTHGGKVATIVQLQVLIGTNRQMDFNDVMSFIPVNPRENVNLFMSVKDTLIKDDAKRNLIRTNAIGGSEAVKETVKEGKKEDSGTTLAKQKNEAELEDYGDYEYILESPDPVVNFQIQLMIIGNSIDDVENQLADMNKTLDKKRPGAQWESVAGTQFQNFENFFSTNEVSLKNMTSTGSNYSGLNFTVSSGLIDPHGVQIGRDVMSISTTDSAFDFDKSLRKQAIIATPPSAYCPEYYDEENDIHPSLSSVIAQRAANQSYMNGSRVHHIVLNDFDYLKNHKMYFRPREVEDYYGYYDVSKLTINPLQGFGDISDVVNIYSRLKEKLVNIFDVLKDLKLTEEDKSVISEAIEGFYNHHSLWSADASLHPMRTRITNIANPEAYPTMALLLNEFSSSVKGNKEEGDFAQATRVNTMLQTLRDAMSSHMDVLGRTTSIRPTNAQQVYYDFGKIGSEKMVQVQYLNVLEYILSTASKNDVVVIHGMNKLYKKVVDRTYSTISSAQKRGIRFIFSFDEVTSTEGLVDDMADAFTINGRYYRDLDADVDYTIIGNCLPEQVNVFAKALNTSLSQRIINGLESKTRNQVLVHRNYGNVNNFVYFRAII